MNNREELDQLQDEVRSISAQARKEFGCLRLDQLNWKAAPTSWSIAQCLEHLITTNATYFPQLDLIARNQKKATLVERLPILPRLWGKLLLRFVDPKSTRKVKAPAKFQPTSSDLPETIVEDFISHQHRMTDALTNGKEVNAERLVITSPAASFVTYTLLDAFRILVTHEHRHFQQAMRVKANENFPN